MGEYANPNKIRPLIRFLEVRPVGVPSVTVPIQVINKMGHN